MRGGASIATLLAILGPGVLCAALPRVALATPGKDGCTGMLHLTAGAAAPIIVSAPGVWCLDQDLILGDESESMSLVRVDADDVVIDCRGHRLESAGNTPYAFGVGSEPGVGRTTVRNCTFRGFTHAIGLQSWNGHFLIEDNVIEATRRSQDGDSVAIQAWGAGTIRRNLVRDARFIGMDVSGEVDIIDNVIDGVIGDGQYPVRAIEIGLFDSRVDIGGNVIRRLDSTDGPPVGILVNSSSQAVIRDNILVGDGAPGSIAFQCTAEQGARLSGNVVSGFAALTDANCHDSGENDLTP